MAKKIKETNKWVNFTQIMLFWPYITFEREMLES